MLSKKNLTQKFIRQLPIEFFYFDPDITAEEFEEFLNSRGLEAEKTGEYTVDIVVDIGLETSFKINRGEYYSAEYGWCDYVFSQEDMNKMFKRVE